MTIAVDAQSLLVTADGEISLAAIERALSEQGFTLGPVDEVTAAMTLRQWLDEGCPGAPSAFADPADHLVAGFVARRRDGAVVHVRPSPRRAAGPDLFALVLGARGRFVAVTEATLRVRRPGERRVSEPLPAFDLDPPVSAEEAALLDAIAREIDR